VRNQQKKFWLDFNLVLSDKTEYRTDVQKIVDHEAPPVSSIFTLVFSLAYFCNVRPFGKKHFFLFILKHASF